MPLVTQLAQLVQVAQHHGHYFNVDSTSQNVHAYCHENTLITFYIR